MGSGLTDIPGLRVGHWTDRAAGTGCTAILCPNGAVAGVDVRGGAPGTRELALLDPVCLVDQVHGLLLAGGSAFGLAAADGVVRWLEEHGYGFAVGAGKVPIVPAAILFDLLIGRPDVRPDAAAGYAASVAASDGPIAEGSIGAGTGATVGKLMGVGRATKGGLGTSSRHLEGGLIVAALAVVNALGDVVNPATGRIVAGVRAEDGRSFADSLAVAAARLELAPANSWGEQPGLPPNSLLTNTTLAVVATNAALTKVGVTKLAQMAHDGLARAIRPVHTMVDGDLVFALSLGNAPVPVRADVGLLGALAAEVLSEAVLRGVLLAEGLHGVPAAAELPTA